MEHKGKIYLRIPIQSVDPDSSLQCDIYIFLNQNDRMLKLAAKQNIFDQERLENYKKMKVESFFILDPISNSSAYEFKGEEYNPDLPDEYKLKQQKIELKTEENILEKQNLDIISDKTVFHSETKSESIETVKKVDEETEEATRIKKETIAEKEQRFNSNQEQDPLQIISGSKENNSNEEERKFKSDSESANLIKIKANNTSDQSIKSFQSEKIQTDMIRLVKGQNIPLDPDQISRIAGKTIDNENINLAEQSWEQRINSIPPVDNEIGTQLQKKLSDITKKTEELVIKTKNRIGDEKILKFNETEELKLERMSFLTSEIKEHIQHGLKLKKSIVDKNYSRDKVASYYSFTKRLVQLSQTSNNISAELIRLRAELLNTPPVEAQLCKEIQNKMQPLQNILVSIAKIEDPELPDDFKKPTLPNWTNFLVDSNNLAEEINIQITKLNELLNNTISDANNFSKNQKEYKNQIDAIQMEKNLKDLSRSKTYAGTIALLLAQSLGVSDQNYLYNIVKDFSLEPEKREAPHDIQCVYKITDKIIESAGDINFYLTAEKISEQILKTDLSIFPIEVTKKSIVIFQLHSLQDALPTARKISFSALNHDALRTFSA